MGVSWTVCAKSIWALSVSKCSIGTWVVMGFSFNPIICILRQGIFLFDGYPLERTERKLMRETRPDDSNYLGMRICMNQVYHHKTGRIYCTFYYAAPPADLYHQCRITLLSKSSFERNLSRTEEHLTKQKGNDAQTRTRIEGFRITK